jgi:hypothetical protein
MSTIKKNQDFGFLPFPSKPVWLKDPYLVNERMKIIEF